MPNHMQDGFKSLVTNSLNPALSFWEERVKPPMLDGGGPIEEATMHSTNFRVRSPKSLATLGEFTLTGAWNSSLYAEFFVIMQRIGIIAITFSDNSVMSFNGWYDKLDPAEMTEGDQPKATITGYPSMQDDTYAETDFDLT